MMSPELHAAGRRRRAGGDARDVARRVPSGSRAVCTPRYARSIVAPRSSRGTTWRIVFDGTAKPTPTLPPPPAVRIAVLTPITRPSESSSGPPELPGLIAASVWMTFSIENWFCASIERPRPETIPADADAERLIPSG